MGLTMTRPEAPEETLCSIVSIQKKRILSDEKKQHTRSEQLLSYYDMDYVAKNWTMFKRHC